jgi:NADP-reducing hydrogenase subunit HndB
MSAIKSLEDLKKIKEKALEKRMLKTAVSGKQIIVGMGTCGIAAGARETMKIILNEIETNNLSGITVSQTGCIGLCEKEPIIQVAVGDNLIVTYGKVSPEVAKRIIKEHVVEGQIVKEYQIDL